MKTYAYAIVLGLIFIGITWGYHAHEDARRDKQIATARAVLSYEKSLEYLVAIDNRHRITKAENALLRGLHLAGEGDMTIVLDDVNVVGLRRR